jgi:hypothetical protein
MIFLLSNDHKTVIRHTEISDGHFGAGAELALLQE